MRSVPTSTPAVALTTHERAVGGGESGDRVALEVEVPRRVDEVDLRVHPLGERAAEVDRVAALDLFRRGVGEGGAVLHRAVSLAGAGHEGERIDQTGLAARPVSDHRDVADFRSLRYSRIARILACSGDSGSARWSSGE